MDAFDTEDEQVALRPNAENSGSHSLGKATLAQQEPDNIEDVDSPTTHEVSGEQPEEEQDIKYGAKHIVLVIVPVTVCMTIVSFSILKLDFYKKVDSVNQPTLYYTPIREDQSSGWGNLGVAVLNSLIFVGIVLVMTTILVLLYKYRCYKVIHGWLIVSSFFLLFFFSFVYMISVGKWLNIAMDLISTFFVLLNFGVLGMMAIHWKAPLVLQQMYLIIVGALMALLLIKYIPPWTTWVLLGALALYDLAAVLLPVGPLRILVNLAQERDEPIFPALIYSSAMVTMADENDRIANEPIGSVSTSVRYSPSAEAVSSATESPSVRSRRRPRLNEEEAHSSTEARDAVGNLSMRDNNPETDALNSHDVTHSDEIEEERGVKLGLGDFIFYSILIGKAASTADYTVVFAVYVAIIFGLIATVVLLAFLHRALPALPISIFFGLSFYFGTMYIVSPFVERLSYHQVFL